MSRNLNARQPGLPSWLELFTDGRTPDSLSGQIAATFNIEDFVNLGKRERINGTSSAVSASNGAVGIPGLVVPAGEAWFLEGFSAQASVAATFFASLQPHVQLFFPGGAQNPFPIGEVVTVTRATLTNLIVCGGFPKIWLPPLSVLGVTIMDLTAASISVSGFADIVRVRI